MAFRGRGRGSGRGRWRGGSSDYRMAKHEPFILFPKIENLPSVPDLEKLSNEVKILINWKVKFERFWKSSSYYLEESKRQDEDVEHQADKLKRKGKELHSFGSYMKLNISNFPAELTQGEKRGQVDSKRLRWDTKQDEFSSFEKFEEKDKEGDGKDNKEKKGEDEEEEDEKEEEESSEDDDYAQNKDFDDDEDDFNLDEEPEEDYY